MDCCLTALSHYLNQCWLIINNVQWQDKRCHGANTEAVEWAGQMSSTFKMALESLYQVSAMDERAPYQRQGHRYHTTKKSKKWSKHYQVKDLFQRAPGLYHPGFEISSTRHICVTPLACMEHWLSTVTSFAGDENGTYRKTSRRGMTPTQKARYQHNHAPWAGECFTNNAQAAWLLFPL